MKAFSAAGVLVLAASMSTAPRALAQVAEVGVGVSADATVYPSVPPPDVLPEDQPPVPGTGYHWVAGYWDWTGYDWEWNAGYWIPERVGYAYFGPRFIWEGDSLIFYRAYWQGPHGDREYRYGGWRAAPPAAWRARPRADPHVWRREPAHSTAWRTAPGAPRGGWRGDPPAAMRRAATEHREAAAHAAAPRETEQRATAQHREAGQHAAEQRRDTPARATTEHRQAEQRAAAQHTATEQRAAAQHTTTERRAAPPRVETHAQPPRAATHASAPPPHRERN